MGSTTPYSLRYPEYATGADPKRDIQYLAEDVAPKLYRAEPLTAAQIAAIASPRVGQLVLNTDSGRVQFWNGSSWFAVGGGASGSALVGVFSLTTTFQTASYFIGLGFTEVNFTFGPVNGAGGGTGAWITAVSDATKARGIITTSSASVIVNPSSTADAYTFFVGGTTNGRVRNIRLDADGYLRMELGTVTGTSSTAATDRINWGAR